jgi:L-asparaginase II
VSATLAKVTRGELVESIHPDTVVVADDGSSRALRPAAVVVIEQLGLAEPAIVETLRERHPGPVKTFGGEAVGEMREDFQLAICGTTQHRASNRPRRDMHREC